MQSPLRSTSLVLLLLAPACDPQLADGGSSSKDSEGVDSDPTDDESGTGGTSTQDSEDGVGDSSSDDDSEDPNTTDDPTDDDMSGDDDDEPQGGGSVTLQFHGPGPWPGDMVVHSFEYDSYPDDGPGVGCFRRNGGLQLQVFDGVAEEDGDRVGLRFIVPTTTGPFEFGPGDCQARGGCEFSAGLAWGYGELWSETAEVPVVRRFELDQVEACVVEFEGSAAQGTIRCDGFVGSWPDDVHASGWIEASWECDEILP